jgi:putative heme-binding domain-containing protein
MSAERRYATHQSIRGWRSRRRLLLLILIPLTQSARAQDPTPQWIWSTPNRIKGQQAVFSRSLEVPAGIRSARLTAVADFCRAKIRFNQQPAITLEPYSDPRSIDISQLLRSGQNRITVETSSVAGPAAFALLIDCRTATTRRTLVTDRHWQWSAPQTVPKPSPTGNAAVSMGPVDSLWRLNNPDRVAISAVDDYTQWKRALGSDPQSDPATFTVPAGFEIERLRTATPEDGSWIALEFDPQGRLIIAREDRGLLRFTLPTNAGGTWNVETIDDSLKECRGVLYAAQSLFVNANTSKALYRIQDLDGDGTYGPPQVLYRSGGSTGHGRNNLALGPDGKIYSIHGDAVELPKSSKNRLSPFREHSRGQNTREGHVLRTDPDGGGWELLAAGLRNPFGIDFNADGEAFTYDADAEHDMGAPWYRPTRVVHLVSGADYGWRGVTGSWPPYAPDHPDNGIPNLDIGKGSPTSVRFGTHSRFPSRWRKALFILDWAYGRILAIHMTPRGASYFCRAEPFVQGRPLNVTGLTFGPDGAMYVVTGGRKTRSALYRVHSTGPQTERQHTPQQQARIKFGQNARRLRKQLEQCHTPRDVQCLNRVWSELGSHDPWIRHAARIALEHRPVSMWKQRALHEKRHRTRLQALLALARSGQPDVARDILPRLNQLRLDAMAPSELLTALYIYRLCLGSDHALAADQRLETVRTLSGLYADAQPQSKQALSELLVTLKSDDVVQSTMPLLLAARDSAAQLHYLRVLSRVNWGWTPSNRRRYFEVLNSASSVSGGAGMPEFLRNIRSDALKSLAAPERARLGDLITEPSREPATIRLPNRPFVRKWSLDDIPRILDGGSETDVAQGQALFRIAQCSQCHRVGELGTARGPDLTNIARRFDRTAMLQSIIAPSLVVPEAFRSDQITTTQGQVIIGRIIPELDFRAATLRIARYPLSAGQIVTLKKSEVDDHSKSPISIMPSGLLDTLTRSEIRNLVGFLKAASQPPPPANP